jgi:hypothetical protein
VADALQQGFGMHLQRAVTLHVVTGQDGALRTEAAASGWVTISEWIKIQSTASEHKILLLGGLNSTMILEGMAKAFGVAWLNENGYAKLSRSDRAAFGVWIEYKALVLLGHTEEAARYLDPQHYPVEYSEARGLEQMVTLEKEYGEYGVLYYVTHGTPPD